MGSERRGSWRALALVLALLGTTGRAAADPTEAEKESARTLLDEGDKRIADNDVEGALRAYQAADAIMRVPTTTIEVAKTLARLGRLVEARDAARAIVRTPVSESEPPPFIEARREADDLVARLAQQIPTVRVQTAGPAEQTKVLLRVDGKVRAATALLELDPGRHSIEASAPGYRDARRAIALRPSDRVQVRLELTPIESPRLPPPSLSPLVPVGFGIGGGGLVVGALFGVLSLVRTSKLDDRCASGPSACPETARADLDTAETFANVSNVGFAVAAAGAVAGVIGLVVLSDRPKRARTGAQPGFTLGTF